MEKKEFGWKFGGEITSFQCLIVIEQLWHNIGQLSLRQKKIANKPSKQPKTTEEVWSSSANQFPNHQQLPQWPNQLSQSPPRLSNASTAIEMSLSSSSMTASRLNKSPFSYFFRQNFLRVFSLLFFLNN